MNSDNLAIFPGGELVAQGLADLAAGVVSEAALLVSLAAPRLRDLGLDVPDLPGVPLPHEHALFEALESRMERGAHGEYNALLGRIVAFAQAYAAGRNP